jgi:hypothetical protein
VHQLHELSAVTNFGKADGSGGDWLLSLHLLPSLLHLDIIHECWAPMETDRTRDNVYLQAVAASPKLQSLSCPFRLCMQQLMRLWWRRAGKPKLNLSRFGDAEWEHFFSEFNEFEGLTGSTAIPAGSVTLRELRVGSYGELEGCCCAYLAHLPHLHTLKCWLRPGDLGHLTLLRQLRQL